MPKTTSTLKASLHWREGKRSGTSMTPYGDLARAEASLAEARAQRHIAWLEYAHFPQYIDATTRGCLAALGWTARKTGRATAEILFQGRVVVTARRIEDRPHTRPYWTTEVDGLAYSSGCIEGLLIDVRAATAPRIAVA